MRRSMLLGSNYEKLFFGENKSQNPYKNHDSATIVMPMNNFEGSTSLKAESIFVSLNSNINPHYSLLEKHNKAPSVA
jgi:hypothetical protein